MTSIKTDNELLGKEVEVILQEIDNGSMKAVII